MTAMSLERLVTFLREQPWAVAASVAADGGPQAAVIGVVVSDDGELFFDTRATSRKFTNLTRDPRIALVLGWDDARTVQYEGRADRPAGEPLARLKARYFDRFPDGRDREGWPDIAYFRVLPTWIRYSDFSTDPPTIVEFGVRDLPARG